MARALDQVGERWTLLVIRNLLLGPKRYSDLLDELPGLTTNLLALRLRELERSGLVARRQAGPPLRARLYELTDSGRALEPAIMELARWGGRFLGVPAADDTLNIGWGLLSCKRRYRGGIDLVAEFRIGERTFELTFESDYLAVSERSASRPDVVVSGTLDEFRAWLFRGADGRALRAEGALVVDGDEPAVEALFGAFRPRETPPEELLAKARARSRPAPPS